MMDLQHLRQSGLQVNRSFTPNSLYVLWEECHLTATDVLHKAIAQALQNINKNGIIYLKLCDGNKEHYPNDLDDPFKHLIRNKIKNGVVLDKSEYKTDVFIVKAGSLARKTLIPGSDIDFLVFPSNKESVAYAQALQKEIMYQLKKIIDEGELPFKVDEVMPGIGNFHVPPEEANEKLLQHTILEYNAEFGSYWPRDSKLPTILRDIEFIYGDKPSFHKLQSISRDRLFTPNTCKDDVALGITRKLVEELRTSSKDSLTNGNSTDNFDPKANGVRPIELFAWLIRARNGIENRNPIEVLKTTNSLTEHERQQLEDAFKFFVLLTAATRNIQPYLREGEHAKLTRDNETRVAKKLGTETPLLRKIIVEHLTASHNVISNYLQKSN